MLQNCRQIRIQALSLVLWTFCFGALQKSATAGCFCATSNSTYVTSSPQLPTTVASPSSSTGVATSTVLPVTAVNFSTVAPSGSAIAVLTTDSQLTVAFSTAAFNSSTPGFAYNAGTGVFTLPATNGTDVLMLVIDLRVGPGGSVCRPMPYLEKVCVSSACAACTLTAFTAAAVNILDNSDSMLNSRIFYPSSIVNTTACANRTAFQDFGDFRYIVLVPMGPSAPTQPYSFTVRLAGNFSISSCLSRKRRSPDDIPDRGDNVTRVTQRSRSRRALPDDCRCPLGQDPVFPSVRTALVSWVYATKLFSNQLADTSSVEYLSLARETYYLVMGAVRSAPASNLTSVVADFADIAFTRAADSGNSGTRMSAKMAVRNDIFVSDDFLMEQLKALIPGYANSIVKLSVNSLTDTDTAARSGLPAYAAVLIVLLILAALTAGVVVALWRMNLLGPARTRLLRYRVNNPAQQAAMPAVVRQTTESTLNAVVQMPETAFQADGIEWSTIDLDKQPTVVKSAVSGEEVPAVQPLYDNIS